MQHKYKDLLERVVLTFVGAFLSIYIATGVSDASIFKDADLLDKAVDAGIASIVPLISGLVGFKIGDKTTASVIPVKNEEPETNPQTVYYYNDQGK